MFRSISACPDLSQPVPTVEAERDIVSVLIDFKFVRGCLRKYVTKMDGTPVQLRGMSLYCSDDSYLGSKFWNAETMQQLKCAWNSNVVRIPLIIDDEGYAKNPDVEYQKVVTAIEAAISTGVYIIVDWHAFSDRLDIAVPFFKNISKLYGQYPHVLYEAYNEPSWADSWTNLTAYHTAIINAVRANDPDNIIIVGQPHQESPESFNFEPGFEPALHTNHSDMIL
uniref:Glycoside hydrolase family 5 domain-containing protein n=1 Tax=Acrobeloides nanus TaxID=290746 RepID=A0A914E8J2_9BILA